MSLQANPTASADREASGPPGSLRPRARRLALLGLAVLVGAAAWYFGWKRPEQRAHAAYLHAIRGRERSAQGDFEGAVRSFEAATRLDPGNSRAWYLLARAHQNLDPNRPRVLEAFARAVELAPNEPWFVREYGDALRQAGRLEEARPVLERAAQLAPTDPRTHLLLGQTLLSRVGSPEELSLALRELRTALNLEPGDVQTRFRLARALFQADRLEEARLEFDTILRLLVQGARETPGKMDGWSAGSDVWFSLVKGSHHYLSQIHLRRGARAEAARHRDLHEEMRRYLEATYDDARRLEKAPQDREARRKLAAVYRRYGLPPDGPGGATAAKRWIPMWQDGAE